jgi:hypothetical protein
MKPDFKAKEGRGSWRETREEGEGRERPMKKGSGINRKES